MNEQPRPGKTKAQCLRTIRREYAICDRPCDAINSSAIVEFAKQVAKRPDVTSHSTVGNYLSNLSSIFTYAPALWSFPLDKSEMDKAIRACKHMGVTGKPMKRERRPTLDELERLLSHFAMSASRDRRIIPMHLITLFAIFSTRR